MPELKQVLFSRVPKMVLIAEFTGNSAHEVREAAKAAAKDLDHLPISHEIAKKKLDSKKYWVIRRESFSLLRNHLKEKHSAPFIDDTIVLPKYLPQFLPELDAMMKEYKLIYSIAGHIGDGNFHIFPLMDMRDPKTKQIIPELSRRTFELVFKYGGSMAGEHNDGLVRTPYLEMMYGSEVVKLFAQFKAIFDPDNIFNPGKKVHVDMTYAVDHILTK
jgi:FAD/FMN-containing dehydrogenase